MVTHARNLIEVTCGVYSQNLDGDLTALMFAHPHIGIPTFVQRVFRLVVTKRYLQRSRK